MIPQLEKILKSAKAAGDTATMPLWAVPMGIYLGGHPDSPVNGATHGIKLMWKLMSKVQIPDLYRLFRDGQLAEKYRPLIDEHTVELKLDPWTDIYYYPK